MPLTSGAAWAALGAVVVVNILLSVDNAVVIALAARSLPPRQQKQAIVWGSSAAIGLRIVLTFFAMQLLQLPWLKLAGALALLWLGAQLLANDGRAGEIRQHGSLPAAIRTILLTDLVMSIDNVIAVAGAADQAPPADRLLLLAIGLALSIPLIVAGSTLLMKVMQHFPLIVTLGAALLGFIAGQLAVTDPVVAGLAGQLREAGLAGGAAGAALVLALGTWLRRRAQPAQPSGAV